MYPGQRGEAKKPRGLRIDNIEIRDLPVSALPYSQTVRGRLKSCADEALPRPAPAYRYVSSRRSPQ